MRIAELVVSIVLLIVLIAFAAAAEVSIQRQRAAGHDSITPAMHRWSGHHQLWSAAASTVLGAAFGSPLGRDFGPWAWVFGVVMLVVAAALVVQGVRQLRRYR